MTANTQYGSRGGGLGARLGVSVIAKVRDMLYKKDPSFCPRTHCSISVPWNELCYMRGMAILQDDISPWRGNKLTTYCGTNRSVALSIVFSMIPTHF